MLKALELLGFKSFADRTRFEFPRGITVVVGPNGSGKSNVVDAIKWVLGEQSARSLRGKEMADVIFNGSGSRPPLNTAETTLTFDNTDRVLPIDSSEVHVTRRVYRSGEGEYLINRQPSRLRDIRDLFAGTGLGAEAYSVIEQGKVDVLLQSSPRDRRMIFEEAAGISRFKAKKVESLRRLERVDQNLLRLADIADEVNHQLKNVRKQAAKARRYKDYADRLQELRTQVGLADWRQLSQRLQQIESERTALADALTSDDALATRLDAQMLELETEAQAIQITLGDCEGHHAENRERIATGESTIAHQRSRVRELEEELARHRRQLTSTSVRAGGAQEQVDGTNSAVQSAALQHGELNDQVQAEEQAQAEIRARLELLAREREEHRSNHLKLLRTAATLANEMATLEVQQKSVTATQERLVTQQATLDQSHALLASELGEHQQQERELSQAHSDAVAQLSEAESVLASRRRQHAEDMAQLAELKQTHSAACERRRVLEDLEQRMEGVGTGVQENLGLAHQATSGPLAQIRGLVADFIRAKSQHAELIDLALGNAAQHLVVAGEDFFGTAGQWTSQLRGRVGFIAMSSAARTGASTTPDAHFLTPAVIGRADSFVDCTEEFRPLVDLLLGKTWLVGTLDDARSLHDATGHTQRFVTLQGELVEADGTVIAGPGLGASGLISRRSQLRDLEGEIQQLGERIATASEAVELRIKQIASQEEQVKTLQGLQHRTAESLAERRLISKSAEQRLAQLSQQKTSVQDELASITQQQSRIGDALALSQTKLSQTEAVQNEVELALTSKGQDIDVLERQLEAQHRETVHKRVALAKSEERLGNLRLQLEQFQRDQEERQRALVEIRDHLSQCTVRLTQSQFTILGQESEIAELYLRKEEIAAQAVRLIGQREQLWTQRTTVAEELQTVRSQSQARKESDHTLALSASEIRLQRDALAARLRDDYGIELAELQHELSAEELQQRDDVDQEIAELRRKLSAIGNVNLESLEEVTELETRYTKLAEQLQDLTAAKNTLERIIGKINADSRRLFAETFEIVRTHFQDLFRKMFAGGQADLLLDEGVDILDSGVEIIARPPGKEPRNISLLSGGEKTLTCVALLLAIFRSRPSPFCVLDEVDAALDEVNIERFIAVLREFLGWTQFVIVTHSKKTMTCANTLHGVTMQDSGVSKRVSVRFEDVSDNGDIRLSTGAKSDSDGRTSDGRAVDDETQAA